MGKLFRIWLFRTFYKRVQKVEKKKFKSNGSYAANQCVKLQNLMNYLKTELIG